MEAAVTSVRCIESFGLPLAPLTEPFGRLLLPLMRVGLGISLRRLGDVLRGDLVISVQPGPDGLPRCSWALSAPEYIDYHDSEWGRPVTSAAGLYERLTLEAFQSGLSWITILRKREGFRTAFAGFDPEAVARFDENDVERLMTDSGIVRNRAKIEAAIHNARVVAELGERFPPLILAYAVTGRPRPTGGRGARHLTGVGGDGARPQAGRYPVRRADHRVRADAGGRPGRRPSPGLLRARGDHSATSSPSSLA